MIESIKESSLYPMVNPSSVAFFGASANPAAMGSIQLRCLLKLGYEGRVYPVHPRDREIQHVPAYASVLDLPETPDLAILVLPTQVVASVLEDCGRKGIQHAIVVSGGFKELGEDGVLKEKELLEIARRHRMRFLGPNCIGVANPHCNLNTTIFPYEAKAGYIGMASQSGSFVTQMFGLLGRLSLGFSTAFSVGNEADVDLVDCLEYLGACPHTRVIALYIEGIKRGRAFLETARQISRRKPIVALYVGGSEAGRKAGLSHTGALAGSDAVYEGLFRQAGVIRVHSVVELFDVSWAMGCLPLPQGPNVMVQTHSGGPGAAAADACARAGLQLPPLAPSTLERLRPCLPPTASPNNPLDLTFSKDFSQYLDLIPKVLLEDPGVHMLMMYVLVPGHMVFDALEAQGLPKEQVHAMGNQWIGMQVAKVAALSAVSGKPILGYTFQGMEEPFIRGLVDQGVPVFGDPGRAACVLKALVWYSRFRRCANAVKSGGGGPRRGGGVG